MSTAAQVPLLANLATSFYLSNAAERHLCERQTNEPIVVTDFGGGGAISVKNVELEFFANSTKLDFLLPASLYRVTRTLFLKHVDYLNIDHRKTRSDFRFKKTNKKKP